MFNTRFIHRDLIHEHKFSVPFNTQFRAMTKGKRVKDRNPIRRVEDLEAVTEKHTIITKFLFLFELLKQQPESIMRVREMAQYRREIGLPKPHSFTKFLKKSPKLFELYEDERKVLWCGLTEAAEDLLEEEQEIIAKNSDKAAEYVTRMLMMAVDRRISIKKISHYRRDMALPRDFGKSWVYKYPELFKVVKGLTPDDEEEYLELVSWKPEWAITELEKKRMWIDGKCDCKDHVPGFLSLAFPMKYPPEYVKNWKSTQKGYTYRPKVYKYLQKMKLFQETKYLSPYADATKFDSGFENRLEKRPVAVLHELLSFTTEKRLVTDHLTYFRKEFVMPQKLMRIFLKYFGIFYVSEKGRRYSVFLTEAYEGSELIHEHPHVMWKEKVHKLIGYKKKNRGIETSEDLQDDDDRDLLGSESEGESGVIETEDIDDCRSELEGEASLADDSEVEIDESESEGEGGVIETEDNDDSLSELEGAASLTDDSEMEIDGSESEGESGVIKTEGDDGCLSELEGAASLAAGSEMTIGEIELTYNYRS